MEWKKSFATHEEAQPLSGGRDWLGDYFPGVALPCYEALKKWVAIRYQDKWTIAQVADVGPWCTDDSEFVFGDDKPRAETHKGRYCPREKGSLALATVTDANGVVIGMPVCNGASIDLFEATALALGIPKDENVTVEWFFLEPPFTT